MDIRETITFVLQKALSLVAAVIGFNSVTDTRPAVTSLAISRMVVGEALLAVAAIVEMMMWRSGSRGVAAVPVMKSSVDGADDRLADRMQQLERALVDRLPPTAD